MLNLDLLQEGRRVVEQLRRVPEKICQRGGFSTGSLYRGKKANIVYSYYPFLFYDLVPQVPLEQVRSLALAARCMLETVLIQDCCMDDPEHSGEYDSLIASVFQTKALAELWSLFPRGSTFWDSFDSFQAEYIHSIVCERMRHFGGVVPYRQDEMERLAAGKAALGKFVPQAMCLLGGRTDLSEHLLRSHDLVSIGVQLWDDFRDWKQDLETESYSYILTNVLSAHEFENFSSKEILAQKKLISQMIYYSESSDNILALMEEYFEQAISQLDDIPETGWKKWIVSLRNEVYEFVKDFRGIKSGFLQNKKNAISARHADVITNDKIRRRLRKGLDFISASISPQGCWEDFMLSTGRSDAWVTGYLGSFLTRIRHAGHASSEIKQNIESATRWVIGNECETGGWGYNKNSGVDADSTSNCLLFLSREVKTYASGVRRAAEVIKRNQNSLDGGIQTFSIADIKKQVQASNPAFPSPLDSYEGWCSSDTCVTAAAGLALIEHGIDIYDEPIQRIRNFILAQQTNAGYWNTYWFNGNVIGTFHCARLLYRLGLDSSALALAIDWIKRKQLDDGGWTDGVLDKVKALDTALAMLVLLMEDIDYITPNIKMAINWLVKNQLDDGSWQSFPSLVVPSRSAVKAYNNQNYEYENLAIRDHRRLYTSITALAAISAYLQKYP